MKKISLILAAFMSCAILFTGCGTGIGKGYSDPEDAASTCLEARSEADGKKLLSAIPQEVIDYVLDNYNISEKELINKLENHIKDQYWDIWEGDLKYQVIDVDYVDKDMLSEAEEELKEYNMNVSIEDGCTVEFDAEIEGEDMSTGQDLIKISGKWYTFEMLNYLTDALNNYK